MARILITSGPTRQYLDPVRYLSNASSGRMGSALAAAALDAGHEVVVVSGPVDVAYGSAAEVICVESTEELLDACLAVFPTCDGLIAAAAPGDYRPVEVASEKIVKNGDPLTLHLVETPDVVASRIQTACDTLGEQRVAYVHPDCGFWMLPRSVADAKMRNLVRGRDLFYNP